MKVLSHGMRHVVARVQAGGRHRAGLPLSLSLSLRSFLPFSHTRLPQLHFHRHPKDVSSPLPRTQHVSLLLHPFHVEPRTATLPRTHAAMARSTRVSAAAGSVQTANALPPSEQKELSALSRATARANEAEENVFLFVPNLIGESPCLSLFMLHIRAPRMLTPSFLVRRVGYARIVLAALALIYMKSNPKACTLLYGVSCLLDAADGMAARALGQSSKFGAVLDMVTDR